MSDLTDEELNDVRDRIAIGMPVNKYALEMVIEIEHHRAALACLDKWITQRVREITATELAKSPISDGEVPMIRRDPLWPGYEPCRECRYWLGCVTEACPAHRESAPSSKERVREVVLAAFEWSYAQPLSSAPQSERIAERVADQLATPAVLSAEDRKLLGRVRHRIAAQEYFGAALSYEGRDKARLDQDAEVAALDRMLSLLGAKP